MKQVDLRIANEQKGFDHTICLLFKTWRDLEKKHGLSFEEGCDDLGEIMEALVELPSGRLAYLYEHHHHPLYKGVTVVTQDATQEVLHDLLGAFGLHRKDLAWLTPRLCP